MDEEIAISLTNAYPEQAKIAVCLVFFAKVRKPDSNYPAGSHSQVHTLVAVVGNSPHAHSMRRMALDTLLSGSGFPASGRWDTSV